MGVRKKSIKNHKKEKELVLNFDGSYRERHGKKEFGCGWILKLDGKVVQQRSFGGECTVEFSSNAAEYSSLLDALEYLDGVELIYDRLLIVGDSKLVINQISGFWKINKGLYVDVAKKVLNNLENRKGNWSCKWTSRDNNQEADELSGLGLNGVKIE